LVVPESAWVWLICAAVPVPLGLKLVSTVDGEPAAMLAVNG
jgi:hypothetical protein